MSTATQPKKATVTKTNEREIRIERIFNADRSRVWRAYTEESLVAQWWGRGNPLVVEKFEPRAGGHWRFVEKADGQEHGFEGRFAEVTPESRLVQTFEWDGMPGHVSLQTAEFEDLGDGRTRLISTALFMTQADCDGMMQYGMEQGMNESYEALDRLLATV